MYWLLTRGRFPYLALLLMVTGIMAHFAIGVATERSNASMTAEDAAMAADYAEFRKHFGNDDILLLAVTFPGPLENGLHLLAELTGKVERMEGVARVMSLSNALQLVHGPAGAESRPLLLPQPLTDADPGRQLAASLDANPDLTGLLVSADRRTAGLVIEIEDLPGDDLYRHELIGRLRQLGAETGGAELHLTGVSVQKNDVAHFVQRDQRVLIPLVLLAMVLLLALFYHRWSGVLLPLAVIAVSLTWTLGLFALTGHSLNTITSLLGPVVMVLSVSTSVHLYSGWQQQGSSRGLGLSVLLAEVQPLFLPCFYTALTTALGLISLTVSDIPAVRQFGLFAAAGVMIAFAVSITLVPVGLSFLPAPVPPPSATGESRLGRLLQWTASLTVERPVAVLAVALALSLFAAGGLGRIRNNTDLVRFLKSDAPLHRDTLFIDQHLGGVNPVDFTLSRRDGRPLTTLEDQRRLVAFVAAAEAHPEVARAFSLIPLLTSLNRAEFGLENLALPESEEDLLYLFDLLEAAPEQELLGKLLSRDLTRTRISIGLRAVGTAEAARLLEALDRDAARTLGEGYRLVPTGGFYQVTRDSNRLVTSLGKSFALSLALVMGAIGLLFRSLKLTLVALVPNLIPLVWSGGVMGYAGIDLSTGTAMIAAVVIGLAVDDTIHYLARYRRERHRTPAEAIYATTTGTGRALVISSVVLVLGFWTGCFGSFKPTVYFSLLTGLTMIGALVNDLLVLPACLLLTGRWLPKGAA